MTPTDPKGHPIVLRSVVFWVRSGGRLDYRFQAHCSVALLDVIVQSIHGDGTLSPAGDPSCHIPWGEVYTDLRDAMLAYKQTFEKMAEPPPPRERPVIRAPKAPTVEANGKVDVKA